MEKNNNHTLFGLVAQYRKQVALLFLLAILSHGSTLVVPRFISYGIDSYVAGNLQMTKLLLEFGGVVVLIFIFGIVQGMAQTFISEKVGMNLRRDLIAKISRCDYAFIAKSNPDKLLTNLTSDIDAVKMIVAQTINMILTAVFMLVGASVLMLMISVPVTLGILAVLPFIALTFALLFRRIRPLFLRSRKNIDRLNKIINESVVGAGLIRVINASSAENQKFDLANSESKIIGLNILNSFAILVPLVTLLANFAAVVLLVLGGHYTIIGKLSIGNFAALSSYLSLLIFPILVLGIASNIIARAQVSFGRIKEILEAPETAPVGVVEEELGGQIAVRDLCFSYSTKNILKNISFSVMPGEKIAIIGPTAAGKTQLLNLMVGLLEPQSGTISYGRHLLKEYSAESFHRQVAIVFQDSITFNLSLEENITFSKGRVDRANLDKAIATAELADFFSTLPQGLDTVVSERGSSLSGGQKQRLMLARALALNPKVIFLDDFTARVDEQTERKILANLKNNYPNITLISVTQKIEPIKKYDKIILIMEGELLAQGKHDDLLASSPEYVQIYNSQKSTNQYELPA